MVGNCPNCGTKLEGKRVNRRSSQGICPECGTFAPLYAPTKKNVESNTDLAWLDLGDTEDK